jgi:hypothetical protein
MNGKARLAWELYLKMETSAESFSLLQLIANDCYKVLTLTLADPNPWIHFRDQCICTKMCTMLELLYVPRVGT